MDHQHVDAHQIAERYLLGRLPVPEAERFEEHALACALCLDRLEAADGLRDGLARVAAEEAAGAVVRTGLLAALARLSRSRLAPWVMAAVMLVALLPAWVMIEQRGDLARQLERSRREVEALRQSGGEGEAALGQALDTTRRELDRERRERLAAAEAERVERERLEAELERIRRAAAEPRINTPVVPLVPTRSAAGEPTVRLTLDGAGEWIVLAAQTTGETRDAYRARLAGPGGKVWERGGLVPDAMGTVTLSLPTGMLSAGAWTLELAGGGDAPGTAGSFIIQVR